MDIDSTPDGLGSSNTPLLKRNISSAKFLLLEVWRGVGGALEISYDSISEIRNILIWKLRANLTRAP